MKNKSFIDWNLHDAALQDININWANRTCDLRLTVFVPSPIDNTTTAIPYTIHFENVLHIEIPFNHPWGDSNFINSQKINNYNEFSIEMQSGDVILVQADKASLEG